MQSYQARPLASEEGFVDLTASGDDDDDVLVVGKISKGKGFKCPNTPKEEIEQGDLPQDLNCFICKQSMKMPSSTK